MTKDRVEPTVVSIDELGYVIKGWGLTPERITALLSAHLADDLDEGETFPLDHYRVREVWGRKRPSLPHETDYAFWWDETEPHARGAGRFTLVEYIPMHEFGVISPKLSLRARLAMNGKDVK